MFKEEFKNLNMIDSEKTKQLSDDFAEFLEFATKLEMSNIKVPNNLKFIYGDIDKIKEKNIIYTKLRSFSFYAIEDSTMYKWEDIFRSKFGVVTEGDKNE